MCLQVLCSVACMFCRGMARDDTVWVLLGEWQVPSANALRDEDLYRTNHRVHQRYQRRLMKSDLMILVCVTSVA